MEHRSNSRQPVENALVARCDSEFFLLDVNRVRRVVDDMTLQPSPFTVSGLAGLARFGGEPLPVFSLQFLAVGEPEIGAGRRTVVVIEVGESDSVQRIGLAVDDVLEIVSVPEADRNELQDAVVSELMEFDGFRARLFDVDALDHEGAIDRCPGVMRAKEWN